MRCQKLDMMDDEELNRKRGPKAEVDPKLLENLPDKQQYFIKGLNKIGISNEFILEAESEMRKQNAQLAEINQTK